MTDYIWMLGGEYVNECESCGSEAPLAKFNDPYSDPLKPERDKLRLCELCSSSYISNLTHNMSTYGDKDLMRATAQAANFTVKKLGGFKGVKSNCPDCGGTGRQGKPGTMAELTADDIKRLQDPRPGRMPLQRYNSESKCKTCKGVNL
jgi:hypothetical protein